MRTNLLTVANNWREVAQKKLKCLFIIHFVDNYFVA